MQGILRCYEECFLSESSLEIVYLGVDRKNELLRNIKNLGREPLIIRKENSRFVKNSYIGIHTTTT